MSYDDRQLLEYNPLSNMSGDPEFLDYLRLKYSSLREKQSTNALLSDLNNYIYYPTIKRACCLGVHDRKIDVQIPIPNPRPSIIDDESSKLSKLYKKFNYYSQSVQVPQNLCSGLKPSGSWSPGSENCDIFYDVFCKNMLDRYLIGKQNEDYDADEFNMYQQDCACYGWVDPRIKPTGGGVPPSCYVKGCTAGDRSRIYPDTLSRTTPCEQVNCNVFFNANNLSAGGSININSQINMKCGQKSQDNTSTPQSDQPNNPQPINPIMIFGGIAVLLVIILLFIG